MNLYPAAKRRFENTSHPGVERCRLRNQGLGGRTSLLRMVAGSAVLPYGHLHTEQVLVLQGRVFYAGEELGEGDYVLVEPGEPNGVRALTNALLYVTADPQDMSQSPAAQ